MHRGRRGRHRWGGGRGRRRRAGGTGVVCPPDHVAVQAAHSVIAVAGEVSLLVYDRSCEPKAGISGAMPEGAQLGAVPKARGPHRGGRTGCQWRKPAENRTTVTGARPQLGVPPQLRVEETPYRAAPPSHTYPQGRARQPRCSSRSSGRTTWPSWTMCQEEPQRWTQGWASKWQRRSG